MLEMDGFNHAYFVDIFGYGTIYLIVLVPFGRRSSLVLLPFDVALQLYEGFKVAKMCSKEFLK